MRTVALLLFPGVQSLDVSGPLDVFSEANAFVAEGDRYRLLTVGTVASQVQASNGQRLGVDRAIGDGPVHADVVLVAGGPALAGAAPDPALCAWLRAMASTTPCYGSICTGAFLLGRAGLLDGRLATTHWSDAHALAAQFPLARVQHDRIHVSDGALITSAGVTAGIDLALSLVAAHHGPAVALSCAKRLLVLAQRQGGQSQFSPYLHAVSEADSFAALMQGHIMAHLGEALPVERLAQVANISERHVARRFAEEMGVTPAEYVQRARIDAARRLLETGGLPLKTVAHRCGFGSAARMRLVFTQRLGITPAQFRDSFRRVDAD